jgi:hypothetical protein
LKSRPSGRKFPPLPVKQPDSGHERLSPEPVSGKNQNRSDGTQNRIIPKQLADLKNLPAVFRGAARYEHNLRQKESTYYDHLRKMKPIKAAYPPHGSWR